MKKGLGKVGYFLACAAGYYLLGAIIIVGVGALSVILSGVIKSYFSMPIWGFLIANLIVGFVAVALYKKLPESWANEPKED